MEATILIESMCISVHEAKYTLERGVILPSGSKRVFAKILYYLEFRAGDVARWYRARLVTLYRDFESRLCHQSDSVYSRKSFSDILQSAYNSLQRPLHAYPYGLTSDRPWAHRLP